MSNRRAIAFGLWLLLAAVAATWSVVTLGGRFYPAVVPGELADGLVAWPILLPGASLAVLIAIAIRRHADRLVVYGYAAWAVLLVAAGLVASPYWALALGLNALLPIAVLWTEVRPLRGRA